MFLTFELVVTYFCTSLPMGFENRDDNIKPLAIFKIFFDFLPNILETNKVDTPLMKAATTILVPQN